MFGAGDNSVNFGGNKDATFQAACAVLQDDLDWCPSKDWWNIQIEDADSFGNVSREDIDCDGSPIPIYDGEWTGCLEAKNKIFDKYSAASKAKKLAIQTMAPFINYLLAEHVENGRKEDGAEAKMLSDLKKPVVDLDFYDNSVVDKGNVTKTIKTFKGMEKSELQSYADTLIVDFGRETKSDWNALKTKFDNAIANGATILEEITSVLNLLVQGQNQRANAPKTESAFVRPQTTQEALLLGMKGYATVAKGLADNNKVQELVEKLAEKVTVEEKGGKKAVTFAPNTLIDENVDIATIKEDLEKVPNDCLVKHPDVDVKKNICMTKIVGEKGKVKKTIPTNDLHVKALLARIGAGMMGEPIEVTATSTVDSVVEAISELKIEAGMKAVLGAKVDDKKAGDELGDCITPMLAAGIYLYAVDAVHAMLKLGILKIVKGRTKIKDANGNDKTKVVMKAVAGMAELAKKMEAKADSRGMSLGAKLFQTFNKETFLQRLSAQYGEASTWVRPPQPDPEPEEEGGFGFVE